MQQAAANLANMDADQIPSATPTRLDEALKYAVSRIEKDPRNVETVIHCLGWDGDLAQTEDRVDRPSDSIRDRTKEIVVRAIMRLREDGFVPDAVERSISLIERSVPILEVELCEALLAAKLSFVKFSCDALLAAVQTFREKPPFEIVRLGRQVGLARSGTSEDISKFAARAQDLVRSRGCANMKELTDDARATFGPNTSERFTEAAVRTVGRFEWLDQESGWFWYVPDRGDGANRLATQIQRILAATPSVRLGEVRSAIRRDNGLGGFAPPLGILAAICRRLVFVQVEGDSVVRAPILVQWNAVLAPNEKIFVDVLQSHGPVLGREEFLEHCLERGMNEETFNQFTSRSAILETRDPNTYALIGATVPVTPTEDMGAESNRDLSASINHGFLSESQVFLAWKLQLPTLQSGVLRVPEPMNTFLEGDYKFNTATNRELGLLHFRQRACWDVRPLLRDMGGDAEDTLVIVVGLRDRRAVGFLGDDDVIAGVVSGADGLPAAVPDADQRVGE